MSGWDDYSYYCSDDPAYHANNPMLWVLTDILYRITPPIFLVFVRKSGLALLNDRNPADYDELTTNRSLARDFVAGAMMTGCIRFANVALAVLFFLVLSRALPPEQFGVFSIIYTLAIIFGYVANVGQHLAILRFWPALDEVYGPNMAAQALRDGLYLTILGAASQQLSLPALGFSRRFLRSSLMRRPALVGRSSSICSRACRIFRERPTCRGADCLGAFASRCSVARHCDRHSRSWSGAP